MEPLFPKIDREKREIEGVSIDALVSQYGSPLLIFVERIIREKYRRLKEALGQYYPNSQIAYSVKTNYLPAIVNLMKRQGTFAEVVSGFELWLARKLGFKPQEIIFNGPDKKAEDIETALREGIMLNADNREELERIVQISQKLDRETAIGLRVSTAIGPYEWNRFGFNLDDGEAYEAVKKLRKTYPRITIAGLHHHLDSNVKDLQFYAEAAEKVSDFAIKIREDFNVDVQYLDFGGGFAAPGSRWLWHPLWVVADIREYIETIAKIINGKFSGQKPKLFVEPGRYLVDEAGVFLATAIAVKEIKMIRRGDGRAVFVKNPEDIRTDTPVSVQVVTVDSSTASIIKDFAIRQHFTEVIAHAEKRGNSETRILTHIAGNSCVRRDFLGWDLMFPEISANDRLLFFNAGAYTIVRSEQFINPRPAVVMLDEGGVIKCVRNKEQFEDMISLDNLCNEA